MVHLISPMEVEPEDEETFLDDWKRLADWLQGRDGFRAARLHRSTSPSAQFRFVSMSIWDDQAAITAAMGDPEFLALSDSLATPRSPSAYEILEEVTGTR